MEVASSSSVHMNGVQDSNTQHQQQQHQPVTPTTASAAAPAPNDHSASAPPPPPAAAPADGSTPVQGNGQQQQQQQAAGSGRPGSAKSGAINSQMIQQYLDENQWLIQAIIENQNLGRIEDCVRYQTRLQQNLLFLASLADFM
eukprot:TRINITY_DN5855_c0_g4_i1.p2 TRINITY_DN5855_c0_g4~~TRINITY_DN5855_c0_g4_i1.p2  ORF type:complete len:143 (-),score=42.23 TRINITY_DN5855_c0_g4_i1:651-1079(-)